MYYTGAGPPIRCASNCPPAGTFRSSTAAGAAAGAGHFRRARCARRTPLDLAGRSPLCAGGRRVGNCFSFPFPHARRRRPTQCCASSGARSRFQQCVLFCVSYVPVYGLDPAIENRGRARGASRIYAAVGELCGRRICRPSHCFRGCLPDDHDYRMKLAARLVPRSELIAGRADRIFLYPLVHSAARFRYLFDTTPQAPRVTDNGKPTALVLPPMPRNRRTDEDYALVCRIFHPDTDAVVLLSGITDYGTSRRRSVCSPARLAAASAACRPIGRSATCNS